MSKRRTTAPVFAQVRWDWWWWVAPTLFVVGIGLSLRVTTLSCQVESHPCPPEVMAVAAELKGRRLLFSSLSQDIQRELPLKTGYQLVVLRRIVPETVELQVVAEPAQYAILQKNSGEVWLVTASGLSYQGTPSHQVPVFETDVPTEFWIDHDQLNARLHHFLWPLSQALSGVTLPTTHLQLASDQLVVMQLQSGQRVLIDPQNPSLQVERLKLLLAAAAQQPEIETARELDVRYKLPVLRK